MKLPPWIRGLAALAAILSPLAIFFLFREVNSTLSDLSTGDASWAHQLYYNFIHGRPLQTSIYHTNCGGVEHNPAAYAHDWAIHINLTPYLFSPLYAVRQSLAGLYAVVLGVNYLGIPFWFWMILRASKTRDIPAKWLLASSTLLLSAGFFWTVTYKNLFILYLGPFFFALYYCLLTENDPGYYLALALCCLVSEDTALFMISWSAYLFLFHPESRRKAVLTGLAAAAWVLVCTRLISPAARFGMVLSTSSHIGMRLSHTIWHPEIPLSHNLGELLRAVAVFSPMLILSARLFQPRPAKRLGQILGLVFLAPASHWFITVTTGGGHHWMPIFLCMFLAQLTLLSSGSAPQAFPWRNKLAAASLVLFAGANAFGLFWNPAKELAFRVVLPGLLHYPKVDLAAQVGHNRRVLAFVRSLPKDRTVTFWLTPSLEAYAADRTDFWRFPDYFSDVDYLVMDRRMPEAPYRDNIPFRLPPEQDAFLASLADARGIIRDSQLPKIADYLVRKGGHRVAVDDEDLLVLERLRKSDFPMPPESIGLGFLRHLPL